MECKFCHHTFSNISSLKNHQRRAKYCLKLRGKEQYNFECSGCEKKYTSKENLLIHEVSCIAVNANTFKKIIESKDQEIKELKTHIKELQDKLENIATASILNDKDKIMKLTKKYVRKRPRQQFDEKNVIYIITTPSLKKERRYILGKATNLTNRLSTYNKTDEHEVVFYKSCNSKEMMSCIENMIFNKLSSYREQANRERFILPEDQEISFFSTKIEECINFFC